MMYFKTSKRFGRAKEGAASDISTVFSESSVGASMDASVDSSIFSMDTF